MPLFQSGASVVTKALCDAFMDNQSGLCDASILTSDGQLVYVVKPVLAARFPYFKSLFYSSAAKTESNLNFSVPTDEKLTRSILEFAYTNNCHTLVKGRQNVSRFTKQQRITDNLPSLVLDTVDLLDAAHQLDIPNLEKRCKVLLFSFMKTFPSTTCTILDKVSLLQRNARDPKDPVYSRLISSVLNNIVQNPQESLSMSEVPCPVPDPKEDLPGMRLLTVADLAPEQVAPIVNHQRLHPKIAFEALYYWATFGCTLTDNPVCIEPTLDASKDRWELAKEFVRDIPLDRVSIAFLTKCVGPTRLVAFEKIAELYRTKLLQIEEKKQAKTERKMSIKLQESQSGGKGSRSSGSVNSKESESESESESEGESESSSSGSESEEDSTESSSSSPESSSSSSSESSSESDSSSDGNNGGNIDSNDSESSLERESGSESTSSASESGSDPDDQFSSESDSESQSNGTTNQVEPETQPRAAKRPRLQSA